ncbi:LPXTG cell wall anchor domain-containing protein [Enterococcus sp. LJL128]|uniref:LPXTG cell wall anchor domain-containing protein n=1 Tax=Enterococcus sp. LJL51 TaxID=3416656 RepID=UPI003CEF4C21
MKKATYFVIASIVLGLFSVTAGKSAEASEVNGGAVQTTGVVGFYDDSTEPSSSSSSSTSTSSTPAPVQKPTGKYPSTGELVKTSLSIAGAVVVGMVLLFFWMKRRENKRKEEN